MHPYTTFETYLLSFFTFSGSNPKRRWW